MLDKETIFKSVEDYYIKDKSALVLFNTYVGKFEADILVLNRGMFIEVEVKRFRNDYFDDFKKIKDTVSKHEEIMMRRHFANKFYFAVPYNLIDQREVPSYAGLMYVDDKGVKVVRRAPKLHDRIPASDELLNFAVKSHFRMMEFRRQAEHYKELSEKQNFDIEVLKAEVAMYESQLK